MNYDEMIKALEKTGEYKVLRRVQQNTYMHKPDGSSTRRALYVDVETTGLSPVNDEIIELAMVPFNYGSDGRIFEVLSPFQSFHEPNGPIPEEITRITGIEQSMVAGKKIDISAVDQLVAEADLIVAHNAAFDRRFLERMTPSFVNKPWGCSAYDVNWREEGFEGTRLGYLVSLAGYFFERHRAVNDCYAAIQLLSHPLPKSGRLAFEALLEKARSTSYRIWATRAPFELKDTLKRRGYKWNSGENGTIKSWYIDIPMELCEQEIAFLRQDIFGWDAPIDTTKIDAYDRYSDRTGGMAA